jgi:hypothetical protein
LGGEMRVNIEAQRGIFDSIWLYPGE